jgi:hypothetical protein
MTSLIKALCGSNYGLLNQKKDLIRLLELKHGAYKSQDIYQMRCPVVQASIGQHIRHSMDHIERAAMVALNPNALHEIHYDIRERGTSDEHVWMTAVARLDRVQAIIDQIMTSPPDPDQSVQACFMLSGDIGSESALPSTIARELGFAAHHAIHHMAMIKIIATNPNIGDLDERELPANFGKAPSTINFDMSQTKSVD